MREKFIYWLFRNTQRIYVKFKNQKAWEITSKELMNYPKDSLGFVLGNFLTKNSFELMPKIENHDVFHVLTGYGTKVQDEIALQYLCFGNGKNSLYSFGSLLVGILLFPDYLNYYIKSYRLGKNCNQFYHFNYKKLLNYSLSEIREIIFNKQQILNIQ